MTRAGFCRLLSGRSPATLIGLAVFVFALAAPAPRALAQDTAVSSAPPQGTPPQGALSRGALTGRVVAAEGRHPLFNVTVTIPALGLTTSSDSAGRYRLAPVVPGEYFVITRAPGFHPDTSVVAIASVSHTACGSVVAGRRGRAAPRPRSG